MQPYRVRGRGVDSGEQAAFFERNLRCLSPAVDLRQASGMAVRRARASYGLLAILAAAAVACSCGGSATSRGPVTIAEIREGTDARHLILSVHSCLGTPTASVVESREEVDLLVESTTSTGNKNACGDGVTVVLREPLNGRLMMDKASNKSVPLRPRP